MSRYRSMLIIAFAALPLLACKERPQPPVSVVIPAMTPQARAGGPADVDSSVPKNIPADPARQGETADNAKSIPDPHGKMTPQEEISGMPRPGQNNDESSLALDPKK